jgi:hypothetical protein
VTEETPGPKKRKGLLGFYIGMGVLLVVLVPLIGNCERIMLARDAAKLRELRASSMWPRVETNSLMCNLFGTVVREGMTYEEVVAVLGRPQPDKGPGEEDQLDKESGRRRCTWFAMDSGEAYENYAVTFDPQGRADFVAKIIEWERDANGRKTKPVWVRSPEDVGRGRYGEPAR